MKGACRVQRRRRKRAASGGAALLLSAAMAWAASTTAAAPDAGAFDAPPAAPDRRWSNLPSPAPGPARSIGAYANGCVQGAVALPPSGRGYDVMRLRRNRFYGHPDLIAYVQRLGSSLSAAGLPSLVVGDLGQPCGGPTLTGHRSHQTGLDVDVAFARPAVLINRKPTATQREQTSVPVVVDLVAGNLTATWTKDVDRLMAIAAQDPVVDRVFVHPVIKRHLCQIASGQPWQARIRPWWGHHDHFHVRLRCPPDSALCEGHLAPPLDAGTPPDDGCGATLAWWFSDDARQTLQRRTQVPAPPPALPPECTALIQAAQQAAPIPAAGSPPPRGSPPPAGTARPSGLR